MYDSFISGAKEIDIAATVEHLRDQRPSMVKTKVRDIMFLCAICMSALCFFLPFLIRFCTGLEFAIVDHHLS